MSSSSSSETYVLSLDQGTTSTRAILFDASANLVCCSQQSHEQITEQQDWLAHDPMEILNHSRQCLSDCITDAIAHHGVTKEQVKALGITNQRETALVWDSVTGHPLYHAIVWSDGRTHDTCNELRSHFCPERIQKLSGLRISPYFSAVKLKWMIDNVPAVADGIRNGTAMFGTIDSWLVWNLSEEKAHVTDCTNAGRTMLMNINTLQWDPELLAMIGIGENVLPEIRSCSEIFGHLNIPSLEGIPIAGLIGDQQSALVGQTCFEVGQAKNTYGTGCFLIINTGTTPKFSNAGLLTTPAYKFGNEPCVYSLEGSVAYTGAAVEWLRDGLGIIANTSDVEALAASVENTGGVYFNPAFNGMLAPLWREDARGTICGITHYTTKAHIARAALESIAFRVNAVLESASKDMGTPIQQLRVDGGASVNNLLMQMQADFTGAPIYRPSEVETTALGAAFAAGRAVGLYQSTANLVQHWQLDMIFNPEMAPEERERRIDKWNLCVEKSLGWIQDDQADSSSLFSCSLLSSQALCPTMVGIAVGVVATIATLRFLKR